MPPVTSKRAKPSESCHRQNYSSCIRPYRLERQNNGEPAPRLSRGGVGHDASPQHVQRQPKPLDGFLALWLRRNCDEQQQRSEYLEVCHP